MWHTHLLWYCHWTKTSVTAACSFHHAFMAINRLLLYDSIIRDSAKYCLSRHETGCNFQPFGSYLYWPWQENHAWKEPIRDIQDPPLQLFELSVLFLSASMFILFCAVDLVLRRERSRELYSKPLNSLPPTKSRLVVPATYTSKTGEFSHTQHQIMHQRVVVRSVWRQIMHPTVISHWTVEEVSHEIHGWKIQSME